MKPIIWLGPAFLPTYWLLVGLAVLVPVSVAAWQSRRWAAEGVPIRPAQVVRASLLMVLGGGVVGHTAWFVVNGPRSELPLWSLGAFWTGYVWYGAFLGGLGMVIWYLRRQRLPVLPVLDRGIPFAVLGHAIGRVGCFLNGCCAGHPTGAWSGMIFPAHPWHPDEALIPTQLFSALALLGLYAGLRWLSRPAVLARPGLLFAIYLASYGAWRFVIEFWRDQPVIEPTGLTLQQLISLGVALAGGLAILARWSTPATLAITSPHPEAS